MNKHKISWWRFYLLEALMALWEKLQDIAGLLQRIGLWFSGSWYCDGCKKNHNRRTLRYSIIEFDYCFEAMRDQAVEESIETGKPLDEIPLPVDAVLLDDENVTKEIMLLAQKGDFWK